MNKELESKLSRFRELCGDDQDKLAVLKEFADDVTNHEAKSKLMESEAYAAVVKDIEDAVELSVKTLGNVNVHATRTESIVALIADIQAQRRILNTMRPEPLEDIVKKLDMSIKVLEEEAKE